MLSAFQFDNDKKSSCGFFGINNMQIQMNLRDAGRMIQYIATEPVSGFNNSAKSSITCPDT